MTTSELIDATANAMDEAARGVVDRSPQLRKPILGWDGDHRIWILRDHDPEDHLYREVTASLVTQPTATYESETFRLEISARAWSTWYRNAPQQASVFSVTVMDKSDVPSVELLESRLVRGLEMAQNLAQHVENESNHLDHLISKVAKRR
ncbi:hypothetical protein [Streptomyces sp. UG1]|uniref:hypothetical protein n=1 Tax=Streptomyces sp. UG1 TaxID=3417652 RepID=UPI003CF3422B